MPTVEFLDWGKKVDCGKYANLRKVAILHGVEVYRGLDKLANCHGNGLCGTCTMQIVDGIENLTPPTLREKRKLKNRPPNIRLSCQCQVLGDVSVITNQALTYEELYAAPAPKPVPVPAA